MKRANPANANNTPRTSRRRSAWLEPIGPEDSRAVTRGLLSKTLLSTRINPSAKKAKVKTTSEMLKTQNIRAKSWLFGSTTTRKAPSASSTQPPIMTRLSTETLPPGTQLHFCSVAIRKRSREARMNAAHGASHGWLAENEQVPKGRRNARCTSATAYISARNKSPTLSRRRTTLTDFPLTNTSAALGRVL